MYRYLAIYALALVARVSLLHGAGVRTSKAKEAFDNLLFFTLRVK